MTNLPTLRRKLNYTEIEIAGQELYFSYDTLIAFRGENGRIIVRRNDWGPTTGKHLNSIDGGSKEAQAARLSGDDFEQAYRNRVERFAPAPVGASGQIPDYGQVER